MRVIIPAIIDQAGRSFYADETDGVSGRDRGAGLRLASKAPPATNVLQNGLLTFQEAVEFCAPSNLRGPVTPGRGLAASG